MRTPPQRFEQHRRRATVIGALVLILVILGVACSLNSPSKTWKALDYAELEQAMESPTGVLSEVDPKDLLVDIPPLVAALTQTIVLFDRIRELAKPPTPDGGVSDGGVSDGGASDGGASDGGASDGGADDSSVADAGADDGGADDGGASDAGAADAGPRPDAGPQPDAGPPVDPGQETEGASVYFKLACPGPDLDSGARDFEFGSFRVDSPTLTKADVDTFVLRGHLLLSFEDCLTSVGTLTGESPAYFDVPNDWLGLRLLVSYQTDPEKDARSVDVSTIVEAQRLRLLLLDSQQRSYVLTVDLKDGVAVTLAGSDQVIGCEYTEDPPAIECGSDLDKT